MSKKCEKYQKNGKKCEKSGKNGKKVRFFAHKNRPPSHKDTKFFDTDLHRFAQIFWATKRHKEN